MKIITCNHVISLIPVLEEWKRECNDSEFGIKGSTTDAANHLQLMIENKSCCRVLAMIDDEERAVGFMGVTIVKNPIAEGNLANEHFWYMIPSCRGKGIDLLKAGMIWAKEKECTHFMATASMLASNLHDPICAIYQRLGMRKFETTYILQIGG